MQNIFPHQHDWTPHSNSTLSWTGTDSHEAWLKNISDTQKFQQLKKYGWDKPDAISYQLNSHGFRCNEFDDSAGIIAIGCSHTAGVGLPLTDIWPTVVSNALGLSVWNLGVGGAAMDTCFRLLNHYIARLTAEYVLLLRPPEQRFELHTTDGVCCFVPASREIHPLQRAWYECPSNGELNFRKNTLALQQLCTQHKKRLIITDLDTALWGLSSQDKWPAARDLQHSGTQAHAKCAAIFLEAVKTDLASRETTHVECHRQQTD